MTENTEFSESNQLKITNLSQVDVETVMAESARMHQSSAKEVLADDVEMMQSAAVNVKAGDLTTHESALVLVQAGNVDMQNSVAGAVRAEEIFINGFAGAVAAGSVELGHARVGVLAGREVRGEKIESVILLARNVQGNITTVMDTRDALIAGLVGGLSAGIMLLLGRMLFGRK